MPPNPPHNNPPVNVNAELLSALHDLTDKLHRLNDYYSKLEDRIQRQPAQPRIFRAEQNETMRRMGLPNYQQQTGGVWVPSSYEDDVQDMARNAATQSVPPNPTPTPTPAQRIKLQEKWNRSRTMRKEAGFRAALGQMSGRIPEDEDPANVVAQGPGPDAYPPKKPLRPGQSMPGGGGVGGGAPPNRPTAAGGFNPNDPSMLTWAVLGEHGGPSFVRNIALEQWGLERSLNWAQQNVQHLQTRQEAGGIPDFLQNRLGVNATNIQSMQDVVGLAQQHPWAAYGAWRAGRAITNAAPSPTEWENQGAALGVPTSRDRYIFGFHNPLSPFMSAATSVGAGAAINRQQLMGRLPGGEGIGSGLSGQQATEAIQNIKGQGFGANETSTGGGDIGMISQHLYGPLMHQMPGLSAEDIGQFLPMLRNSAASITDLRTALQELGSTAVATHESVGQAASSLNEFVQSTQGMGSQRGRLNLGQGFTEATGIDPQIAGQMLQNPMVQGMAVSRYGILPSGLGDINPGAATGLMSQSLNMLMNVTRGLNHDVYGMVNGRRTVIESGQTRQIDQVAQMMGIDPQIARRMLSQQSGDAARGSLVDALRGPGGFMAMTNSGSGHENTQQRQAAQRFWNTNIANRWQNTGISQKEMQRLGHEGFSSRIRDLQTDLNKANANTTWGTTQQNPNNQVTVNVQFKGEAAKYFTQSGPTTAKQASNAGNIPYANTVNSVMGDIGRDFGAVPNAISDIATGNIGGALHNLVTPFGL